MMNKFRGFVYKNRFYLLAFAIPLLILTIAYIAMGVWPFGERQVQVIDSYHQYAPFFSEFHRKIWSGESLFYSFNGGLGMNFWAIVAYYLASPLNILLLLFPPALLLEGFTFLLMLKVALCGLTFAWYVSHRFSRYNVTIVYFALFYALCGWVLGYNWNVMWLDCAVLLPLIILGLERLVKQGQGLLYGLTLGLAIVSNYYIAIMICIFVVLYFFVLFFEQKKKSAVLFFRRGFLFAGYSLLAGALSACLLLPTLAGLMVSNSAQSKFPTNIKFYNSITELIGQQFAFVAPTDLSGKPNLYFGVLTLLLVFLYIFHRGISLKNKVMKLALLGFLLFSTNFRILDYIWHGFHFPNSLPARFTFIYAFLALSMAFEVVMALGKYAYWQLLLCGLLVPNALLAWCVWDTECDLKLYTCIITEVLIVLYFIILCLYRRNFAGRGKWRWILFALVVVEVAGNGIYGLCENGSINRTAYNKYLASAKVLKDEADHREDGGFYRMELETFSARNNNMWLDFPGISLFASTMGADINDLMKDVGYFSATNKYSYVGATSLTDSIFGVKYLADDKNKEQIRTFRYITESGQQSLYENPYALSLGFMVDETYENWNLNAGTPADVLNDFVKKTTGTEKPLFVRQPMTSLWMEGEGCTLTVDNENLYSYKKDSAGKDCSLKWSFDILDGSHYYIYYEAANCDKLKVSRNDAVQSYSDTRGHFVELGDSGHIDLEFITDKDHSSGKIKIYLFTYDDLVFEQFYASVCDQQWEIEKFSPTRISGRVNAGSDGMLFTSLPYDKGWHVKVDGQPVEAKSIDGALLYLPLEAGEHEISMRFIPVGFLPGLLISLTSCLIFAGVIVRRQKRKRIKR